MTLTIQNFLKYVCFGIMSKNMEKSGTEDHHSERLLDDSSDDEIVDKTLKTTEEERRGTIPGSVSATASALAGARAQANPIVERGPPRRRKKSKTQKTTDTVGTQTPDGKET